MWRKNKQAAQLSARQTARLRRDYRHVLRAIERFNRRSNQAITARELSVLTRQVTEVALRSARVASDVASGSQRLRHEDVLYDKVTFDKEKGSFSHVRRNFLSRSAQRFALCFRAGRSYYARRAAQSFAEAVARRCGHHDVAYNVLKAQGHDMVSLLHGDLVDSDGHYRPLSKHDVARTAVLAKSEAEVHHECRWFADTATSLSKGGALWHHVVAASGVAPSMAVSLPDHLLRSVIEASLRHHISKPTSAIRQDDMIKRAAAVVACFASMAPKDLIDGVAKYRVALARGRHLLQVLATDRCVLVIHGVHQFEESQQAFLASPLGKALTAELGNNRHGYNAVTAGVLRSLCQDFGAAHSAKVLSRLQGATGANWALTLGVLQEDADKGLDLDNKQEDSTMRRDLSHRYSRHQQLMNALEESLIDVSAELSYYPSERNARDLLYQRGVTLRRALDEDQVFYDPTGSLSTLRGRIEQTAVANVSADDTVEMVRFYGGLWGARARQVQL